MTKNYHLTSLRFLREKISQGRHVKFKGVFFLQDKASANRLRLPLFTRVGCIRLSCLFPTERKFVNGRKFSFHEEMIKAAEADLQSKLISYYSKVQRYCSFVELKVSK